MAKRASAAASLSPRPDRPAPPRTVWLTFDDGPHPVHTPSVLKTLDDAGIKATFFLIGREARRYPSIVRDIHAAGHRIGNHTYTHPDLRDLSPSDAAEEIRRTEAVLDDVLGNNRIFRPPYGGRNASVDRTIRRCGYRSVLWNAEGRDWNADYQPDLWVARAMGAVALHKRSVVLLHDIHRTTAAALPAFIRLLRELGGVTFGRPSAL